MLSARKRAQWAFLLLRYFTCAIETRETPDFSLSLSGLRVRLGRAHFKLVFQTEPATASTRVWFSFGLTLKRSNSHQVASFFLFCCFKEKNNITRCGFEFFFCDGASLCNYGRGREKKGI